MAGTVGEMRCRENKMKCELCGREMNSYNSYNSYTDTLTGRKAVLEQFLGKYIEVTLFDDFT